MQGCVFQHCRHSPSLHVALIVKNKLIKRPRLPSISLTAQAFLVLIIDTAIPRDLARPQIAKMYKTETGHKKFSFTRFMSNAVPNVASAPQDTNLSSREQDLAFTYQMGEPNPLFLSPDVFIHAGITSAPKMSASIHKALHRNSILDQDSPMVHTEKITKNFANQVPGITSHAQKKLINFLFFWEEEGHRWKKLTGELEELKAAIAEEEEEAGGNVRIYEKRLAEVEGEMKLRPSLRSQRA